MLDFITIPLIVGIVCAGIYGLFELIIRKKERLLIIEKIGDKLNAPSFEGKLSLPSYNMTFPNFSIMKLSFNSLKIGLLLTGIGLGLIIGVILYYGIFQFMSQNTGSLREAVFGSCVLLFGGMGLLASFLIELHLSKKKESEHSDTTK